MGEHIATCGHETVCGGFSFTTNGYTRDCKECSDYSTYCHKCVYEMLINWDDCYELRNTDIGKLKEMLTIFMKQ